MRRLRLDALDLWAALANSAVTRCTLVQHFHQFHLVSWWHFAWIKSVPFPSLQERIRQLCHCYVLYVSLFIFFLRVSLRLHSESDSCGCGWILRSCFNCMQNICTTNTLQYQPMDQKQKLSGLRSSNDLRASNQAISFQMTVFCFHYGNIDFCPKTLKLKRLSVISTYTWNSFK